jgi:nitrate reductase cytochrome c-type subunit
MRLRRCFLCHRKNNQASQRAGISFFYMISCTKSGRAMRRYFCSECEDSRTPEIKAEYRASEKRRGIL